MTKISLISRLKLRLKYFKKEIGVLYLASKRDDVPWYAKLVILLVVGYALSPIDLIPDFIPVFGYLDDLIIVPIGVTLAIRLIPNNIINECREQSESTFLKGRPKNWIAGGTIIFIWIVIVTCILIKLF